MSTDYEPGTIATATVRGTKGVRLVRGEDYWALAADTDDFIADHSPEGSITDVRPLVVLDLDGHERERAVRCIRFVEKAHKGTDHGDLVALIADQIEAQMKPPRIPEPGMWGVVEAHIEGDGARTTFLHHDMRDKNAASWHETGGSWWFWSDLIDPVLIREGVES